MGFTDEDKIIIKYLRTKYNQSPLRIMEDHPERNKNWTIGGLKSQETINQAIDSFKLRLKRVIEENGGHIKNIMIDLSFTINVHHFDI